MKCAQCPLTRDDVTNIIGYLSALSVLYEKVLEIDTGDIDRLTKLLIGWVFDNAE